MHTYYKFKEIKYYNYIIVSLVYFKVFSARCLMAFGHHLNVPATKVN